MKRLVRIHLLIFLGAVAVGLTGALWNISRPGRPHGISIPGVVGRYGMTSADPLGVLFFMSVLNDAALRLVGGAGGAGGRRFREETGGDVPNRPTFGSCGGVGSEGVRPA
jgi:hypothetical protein